MKISDDPQKLYLLDKKKAFILIERMKNILNLLQNSFYNFGGFLLIALYNWLIISIISKKFGTVYLGQYMYILSIITPIIAFACLNLKPLLILEDSKNFNFNKYLSLRIILFVFIFLIINIFIHIFIDKNTLNYQLFLLILIFKLFENIVDMLFAFFQRTSNFKNSFKSIFLRFLFITTIFLFVLFDLITINIGFLLSIVSIIICIFIFEFQILQNYLQNFKKNFSILEVYKLLISALPLGFTGLIYGVYINLPRYFFKSFHLDFELGIFSGIFYLVTIFITFGNSFIDTQLPEIRTSIEVNNFSQLNKVIKNNTLYLIGFCLILFLINFIWGENLLTLVYNKDFSNFQYLSYFAIFLFCLEMINKTITNILTAFNKIHNQVFVLSFSTFLIFIICYFFINSLGTTIVFLGYILISILQLIFNYLLVQKCLILTI